MKCPYCSSPRIRKAGWPTTNRLECRDCAGVFMPDGSALPPAEYEPLDNPSLDLEKVITSIWGPKKEETC